MNQSFTFSCSLVLCIMLSDCSHRRDIQRPPGSPDEISRPLTVIAIGDAGDPGKELRGNAHYITSMYTGQHDAGPFDAMIFLGDNFYPTGLNMPKDEVSGTVKKVLGRFRVPFEGLGRSNVHSVAGNHDYYAKNAIEKSILFGLISISEGPVGLTERGNERELEIDLWSYYYKMPAQAIYALGPGSVDSVQFIFYDSALPLRTDAPQWRPALDSLRRILSLSTGRPGLGWRILAMHHPWYSVGEHGGYTVWNDETATVEYLTQCDKDSNAIGWLKNLLDPEDLCAEKYQQFVDSLKAVLRESGAKVQLSLAGHDHSLQILFYPEMDPDCDACPRVHVISGAGSKTSKVKFPSPPNEFTSAQTQPSKEGLSLTGFAQLQFEREKLRIVFFNGSNGNPIDMGGGKTEFWINREGQLIRQ